MLIGSPWVYVGSTSTYHRFRYAYTRGNSYSSLRVYVRKTDMNLPFEKSMRELKDGGIDVVLIFDESVNDYRFSKVITPNQKDSDWLQFQQEVPEFNSRMNESAR